MIKVEKVSIDKEIIVKTLVGAKGERGEKGLKGDTGANGRDGTNGINGTNGTNGTNGVDGFSPTATVTQTTTGATISITDKNGTTSANITNGQDGESYTLPIASDTTLGGIKIGNNLTIEEDGTLNATGGGGTIYHLGNALDFTSETPLLLNNLEKGKTYAVSINTTALSTQYIYFKAIVDDREIVSSISIPGSIVMLPYYINFQMEDNVKIGTFLRYQYSYIKNNILYCMKYYGGISSSYAFSFNNNNKTFYLSYINNDQTISGKKTFTTLPETSIAPTTDNQMVNKKYVDDTIASAITTTLGGSY